MTRAILNQGNSEASTLGSLLTKTYQHHSASCTPWTQKEDSLLSQRKKNMPGWVGGIRALACTAAHSCKWTVILSQHYLFCGLSRGRTVFSCTWQLGAQREVGEQARWVSQSISIYITQFIWRQRPCSSHSSLQIREGTGESSGEVEYYKNKKVTSIVVEENRDMWEIFCWQGVTWGAKTTET